MVLTREQKKAFADLKYNKGKLTVQQYRTVKGQLLAGDTAGALKGLQKLLEQSVCQEDLRHHADIRDARNWFLTDRSIVKRTRSCIQRKPGRQGSEAMAAGGRSSVGTI